jgi:hypothetical protein
MELQTEVLARPQTTRSENDTFKQVRVGVRRISFSEFPTASSCHSALRLASELFNFFVFSAERQKLSFKP